MAEPEFEPKPLHSSQYGETRAVTSKTWLLLLLSRLKHHNFPIFLKFQPRLTFEFSSFSSPYIILFIIILFICYFYLCSIYYSRYLFIPLPLSPIISVILFLPAVWAPHGQGRYHSLYPTQLSHGRISVNVCCLPSWNVSLSAESFPALITIVSRHTPHGP